MSDALDKNQIQQLLHRVFPKTPIPTEVAWQRWKEERPWEVSHIQKTFSEKPWQTLSRDTLLENASMLIYFTTDAFRYYLPAYLLNAVDYERSDYAGMRILDFLAERDHGSEDKEEIVQAFTMEQKQAILKLFEYLQRHFPESNDIPEPSRLLYE